MLPLATAIARRVRDRGPYLALAFVGKTHDEARFAERVYGAANVLAAPGIGRGPILVSCCHGRPDLAARAVRDEGLHTGERRNVDEAGDLYRVDRSIDRIDSGGVQVDPKDIEQIAARHLEVREVAVSDISDDKRGEPRWPHGCRGALAWPPTTNCSRFGARAARALLAQSPAADLKRLKVTKGQAPFRRLALQAGSMPAR